MEVRARYEHVEQVGLPRAADALTLRARPSITATNGGWSALVEAEAVAAPVNRYDDALNGRAGYPVVADPENIELNRAQVGYKAAGFAAVAGRQRIALADDRFVATAPWRMSEQTFDAVRVQAGKPRGLSVDATYARAVRTVYGREGFGARPTAIGGDNLFALVNWGMKAGTLTGFAYLVDQDAAAVQQFRLSSQTYGVRFSGSAPAGPVRLGYAATVARQSDYARNPNDYAATYRLGEVSAAAAGLTALGGYEVLGADRGMALTSVQAPLGAAFKCNGWVGKFTTAPPDGVRNAMQRSAMSRPSRLGAACWG